MSAKLTRDEVIARLKSAEPQLRARGVGALYLYGSYARDEARVDSDIDVFVEAASRDFYDLSPYMGAFFDIQEVFPEQQVGYTTKRAFSPHVLVTAERDAIRVF